MPQPNSVDKYVPNIQAPESVGVPPAQEVAKMAALPGRAVSVNTARLKYEGQVLRRVSCAKTVVFYGATSDMPVARD